MHLNAGSLRSVALSNNNLEKSLIKLLVKSRLVLYHLNLAFISFSIEEFKLLSGLELSFLKSLSLASC